jgi:glycosyltransferase involved in cell wall biosynthesis
MAPTGDGPYFSVLVTAYNRSQEVQRCVRSCLAQTDQDFEIVVADDASTDGTAEVLAALREPRLRVIRHERNRGISTARATAVDHAAGQWFVMVDSDWELLPHALARLRVLIDTLPPEVRIIRSRIEWESGNVDPGVMPERITDYHGRMRWLEAVALAKSGSDAGHCIHRSVFERANYFTDRRGAVETLWELDLARHEQSLWVTDVLTRQYDAPNSYTRDASPRRLIPRLMREAPDQLWMAETVLAEHGAELARHAPHYRDWIVESASVEAFLAGQRVKGIRYATAAARASAARPKLGATVLLGLLGPRALAQVKASGRQLRAWRGARLSGGA